MSPGTPRGTAPSRRAALAALLVQACTLSGSAAPRPSAVEPSRGFVSSTLRVVIHGDGFPVRTYQPSTGGEPAVDSTYRAWLGGTELEQVDWIDLRTLHATVPAGLPAGAHALVVEGPFGRQGSLAAAFTVLDVPPGALSVTVAANPATASVGQAVSVSVRVENSGSGVVTGVVSAPPTAPGGGGAVTGGPEPASVAALAPGEAATFAWTFTPSTPGSVAVEGSASATDALSRETVRASTTTSALVMVQRPASPAARLTAPRSVALGTTFEVAMEVANGGEAPLVEVVPSPLAPTPGTATATLETGPVPSSASIAGGTSAVFTWRYRAGDAAGSFRLSGTATGRDGNSGAPVTSPEASTADTTVGRAALLAGLSAAPPVVAPGAAVTLTLELSNPGTAPVTGIVPGIPVVGGTGLVDPVAQGPVPPSIATLAAGAGASISWTYTARGTGSLGFSVGASGTDGFSGSPLLATASVQNAVTVTGGSLAVVGLSASPTTGAVGAPVTLTLDLANRGAASVSVTAVTPSAAPASTAACSTPAPAVPVAVPAGGTARFSWTCTAQAAGTYLLGGTVTALPYDTGVSAILPLPGVTVPVLARSFLVVSSFTSSRAVADTGQAVGVTLRLANPGPGAATISAVQPAASPAGVACTAAAPAPPRTVAAGTEVTFTWSCTASVAGSYRLGGSVTATDASTGASVAPALPELPLTAQLPASLSVASFAASPSTVAVGGAATVTLVLRNGGGATASVASIAPSISPANRGTCTAATPAPPTSIAGGTSATFTWTCSGSQRRAYTLDATVTASDANTGSALAVNVPTATLTVQ